MYSKFRKSGLCAAALAAVLLVNSVPAANAQTAGTGEGNYTFGGALTQAATGLQIVSSASSASAVSGISANNPFKIVAVGDSMTVGYELGMAETSTPYGYANRVYEQALYHGAAELTNFGVLGLKSAGLRAWLDAAAQGQPVTADEAQSGLSKYPLAADTVAKSAALKEALENANLVVMTIGGNDFLPLFNEIRSRTVTPEELEQLLGNLLKSYNESLEASLRAIHALNPNARIVLADQYLPVPKPSIIVKAVTEEQYAVLQDAVADLHDALVDLQGKLASDGLSLSIVDIATPFAGQEFFLTSVREGDVHPNDDGYEVMGREFAKTIWGSYREAGQLPAGTPLHIVVNGKEVSGGNKPILKNGTTFLPMVEVAKALGATLSWDNKTKTATLKAGGKTVAFTIGASTMKVNGETLPLATPAYLQPTSKTTSSTYLPLAALSKGLGYQVVYRKPIQTVFINE